MKSEIYELTPVNGRKSFNGKAKVIVQKNVRFLLSYDTIMGAIDADGKVHRYSDFYSATTVNHVRSFCDMGKKEFWSLPLEKCPKVTFTL